MGDLGRDVMDCVGLHEMIRMLCYGTKLHVGVLFFGKYGNPKLTLPFSQTIHASPVCACLKESGSRAYERCLRCRNAAIKKAMEERLPFGGLCSNGIYEYTYPVTDGDHLVCIIYIGNILEGRGSERKLTYRLKKNAYLIDTMERNYGEEQCMHLAKAMESYIRMLLLLYPTDRSENSFDPLVENVKAYINANLEYDVSILELSRIFHYNEKYLGRLFKKETGQTVHEYINSERLYRAEQLLAKTDDSILSIATRTGFNNVTYFNRVFKKQHQKTPLEFRKDARNYVEFQ